MLVIIAKIKISHPELCDMFRMAKQIEDASRQEDGCFFFHVAYDDTLASSILIVEGWRNQATLDTHMAQPRLREMLEKFAGKFTINMKSYTVEH